MTRALTIPAPENLPATLAPLIESARDYMAQANAPNTARAYGADWRTFAGWCESKGLDPMPPSPQAIALYLAAHAGVLKVSTLQRRMSGIVHAARHEGHDVDTRHPALRDLWRGIKRAHGSAPNRKAPTLTPDVLAMLAALPDSLQGKRDRAVILAGFAGAFRRSELAALDLADIAFSGDGAVITLRRSKTDQDGEGRKVGIPFGSHGRSCPVLALRAWIEAAGLSGGRLFRSVNRHGQPGGSLSPYAVALIVKRAAERVGLDPATFAGHSLRAGFATSAARADVSERGIMEQGRWRSLTVARGYIRDGSLFRDNPAAKIGL
jgi:integrase